MDAYHIARMLVMEKRNPSQLEAVDLVLGCLWPPIFERGGINTREAEDRLLDFLGAEGFRLADVTPTKAGSREYNFRKTIEFGLIAMKGQGISPIRPPLLRDAKRGEYRPVDPYGWTGRYTAYVPTEQACEIYQSSGHRNFAETLKSDVRTYFRAEGPTGELVSRKYYSRDNEWRDFLLFRAGDKALCWCCEEDMIDLYGEIGWKALFGCARQQRRTDTDLGRPGQAGLLFMSCSSSSHMH